MIYASLAEENKLWKKGYKLVAGLDEAGRGPLAGPVVAAAMILRKKNLPFPWLRDSKQFSAKQREEFYKILTSHQGVEWGIGIVSEKIIDRINILEATKLAMIKAVKNLKTKLRFHKIDFLILDGNMKLALPILQKSIVKGDEKVFSCAAASIIAKIARDRIMLKYHKKYPQYNFHLHKGYGTKLHFAMLKKYGFCKIHRQSFYPVSACKIKQSLLI